MPHATISGAVAVVRAAVMYKNYASADDATANMRVFYAKSNLSSFYPLIFIDIDRDFTMGSKTELYCECSATVHIRSGYGGETYNLPPETEIRVKKNYSDIINGSYYHRDGNELTGKVIWELVFHRRGKICDSWDSYNESYPELVPEWRSRVQNNTCGCARCKVEPGG